jgi:hypothetical protein
MSGQILFLDFDGVLHADPVFLTGGVPSLDIEHGTLFEWAPILAAILDEFPSVDVVLSTTWAAKLGFMRATMSLPDSLSARVIDCVWQKNDYVKHGITEANFLSLTRYGQITQYIRQYEIGRWISIDNDANGWPSEEQYRLVKTEDLTGLSSASSQAELRRKLMWLTS